jgi:glutathione S-transferase
MKLLSSPLSPYGRKVKMTLLMKGLADKVEIVAADTNPGDNVEINGANPLGKIPALIVDGKTAIFDSHVICEYLDTLHGGRKIFPAAGPQRFAALRRQALTDGILDAAVLCRYETAVRPEPLRWKDWIEGQKRKIFGGLAVLEAEAPSWSSDFDIGHIGAACVLLGFATRFAVD